MTKVRVLGGDSTNVNVGKSNGAIAQVEQKLGVTFQRFICLFHLIELLLRHFVGYYVGETSGPRSFSSPLGKAITNLANPVISAFKKIPAPNFPIIPEPILNVRQLFFSHWLNVFLANRDFVIIYPGLYRQKVN